MTDHDLHMHLTTFPATPFGTKLAWEAVVTVSPRQDLGMGPIGHRFIVPITGGIFRGGDDYPNLYGEVLSGGADRQVLRKDGVKELHAVYEMKVHDGSILNIDNRVVVDLSAEPTRYAVSRISVTAPEGEWDWLNRKFFLGSLQSNQPNTGFVVIRGWEVTI